MWRMTVSCVWKPSKMKYERSVEGIGLLKGKGDVEVLVGARPGKRARGTCFCQDKTP